MSELGQNEGQEQEEKTPFFDSSKISDKKDVEHFANVEGAEERAKAAERAKKAAEKEAQEVHAADVRAASEQIKKTEQAESGKKGIVGFLFGGWHKIITIGILLAVCVAAILLVLSNKTQQPEVKNPQDNARSVYEEALVAARFETYNADNYLGEQVILNAIESSPSDEHTAMLKVVLARYYSDVYGDYGTAMKLLDEANELYQVKSSEDCFVLESLVIIYRPSGNAEEYASSYERYIEKGCGASMEVEEGENEEN